MYIIFIIIIFFRLQLSFSMKLAMRMALNLWISTFVCDNPGQSDGEGIERNWSVLNKATPSFSMMGPGGQWDVSTESEYTPGIILEV